MIHNTGLLLQTTAPVVDPYRLTAGGWMAMILSVGLVTLLLSWCIYRVMRESSAKKVPAPVDIDTGDLDED